MRNLLKYGFLALVLAHVAFLAYHGYGVYVQVFEPRDIPEADRKIKIAHGATLVEVLEELRARSLSPSPYYVRAALALHQASIVVKTGTYLLPERASTWEIINQFHEGRVLLYKITVAEGLDKWQTAEALATSRWGDETTFAALVENVAFIEKYDPDATDLEGYLYPETYMFEEEATPRDVVTSLVNQFLAHTDHLRATKLPESGLTLREWVTLASLIEEETSVPEERTTIASVFHNRLRRGMLLQCDPTIIYSLKLHDRYRGKIYKSDIRYDHPYNTYVYGGLPPGPIASPSLASLRAALEPDQTSYLYFVARADGTHQFSRTLREHNRAVARFRRGQ